MSRAWPVALALAAGCATRPVAGPPHPADDVEAGLASFYADSLRGRPTASGAPYDPEALTCAHRSLPFGTRLRVTEVVHGRSVVVTVNDRGPFVPGRIVDVSRAAAAALGMLERGVAQVRVERVRRERRGAVARPGAPGRRRRRPGLTDVTAAQPAPCRAAARRRPMAWP
jgi:rare lipoprotein A (peptidoglycan hydrolase)